MIKNGQSNYGFHRMPVYKNFLSLTVCRTADVNACMTVCLVKIFTEHIKENENHCLILSSDATDVL